MRRMLLVLAGLLLLAGASTAEGQATAREFEAKAEPGVAPADRDDAGVAGKIAARYVALAGSEENALALVLALRNGERVTLVSDADGASVPVTTIFELPTGRMGWDNVNIALALAKDSLVRAGITLPTAEELQSALIGGDVTGVQGRTTLRGVLTMLADGLEWRQIRQAQAPGKGT
jgi:hypothetical protein